MYAHRNAKPQALRNQRVCFHVSDAYVPEPTHILSELHGRDLLHGPVIGFSDRGPEKNAFVVVEVEGLSRPIVVPIEKLLRG